MNNFTHLSPSSLNKFHTFECASRHLSFTLAAQELHLTQGAVSQQIKQLESELCFKLFHRLTRKLILTEEGKILAKAVERSLSILDDTLSDLYSNQYEGILNVSCLPSFTMKWLIPRLGDFQSKYPNISIRLSAEERLVNFKADGVDVAIRYGQGKYEEHLTSDFLMREEIFPVCSPRLLEGLKKPEDLQKYPLLEEGDQRILTETDWKIWFKKAGLENLNIQIGSSFNRADLAIETAILGQGVALGRTYLVADDLRSGRLVRPFTIEVETDNAHYLVYPKESIRKLKLQAFRNWLTEKINEAN